MHESGKGVKYISPKNFALWLIESLRMKILLARRTAALHLPRTDLELLDALNRDIDTAKPRTVLFRMHQMQRMYDESFEGSE